MVSALIFIACLVSSTRSPHIFCFDFLIVVEAIVLVATQFTLHTTIQPLILAIELGLLGRAPFQSNNDTKFRSFGLGALMSVVYTIRPATQTKHEH